MALTRGTAVPDPRLAEQVKRTVCRFMLSRGPLHAGAERRQRHALVFRESLQTQGPHAQGPVVLRALLWHPAHFVMVHRVLEGIKERAEAQPLVPSGLEALAHLGWIAAGVALLATFAAHRRWWPWLLVPLVLLVPPFLATGDLDSTLAGFIALGITITGALAFERRLRPAYVLLAAVVLFVLLLATDAFAAFGLTFLVFSLLALAIALAHRGLVLPPARLSEGASAMHT